MNAAAIWSRDLQSLILGLLIGLAIAVWSIWKGRRASASGTPLLRWDERVVSPFRQDPVVGVFLAMHAGTLVALAGIAAIDAMRPGSESPSGLTQGANLILGVIAGAAIGFPFASRFGPAMPMAVYREGVIRGRFSSGWTAYSHFGADHVTRVIRLYGRRTPEVARVAWRPPTEPVFAEAVEILGRALPTAPPLKPSPLRRRTVLLALAVLLTVPALALAAAVSQTGAPQAPLVYTAIAYVECLAGIGVITNYEID